MKKSARGHLVIAVLFALAGNAQQGYSAEVPEGITAEDWGIVQEAYLKASNTDPEDCFGSFFDDYPYDQKCVAISGDTIVIGAFGEDSNASGINGNQSDNSTPSSGAAYVFVRNETTWTQQAYLKASNTEKYDGFGYSVAISGDTVAIGVPWEKSSATGVNGDESDNSAPSSGAAYVFVRTGTAWSQQAYLKASNTGSEGQGDQFGRSIAIADDTIVIGAFKEKSNATGVNGNQSDNSASDAGAAYVFVRSGTTWVQEAYLKASNTGSSDWFGASVDISDDTIVIGATYEKSNATGINGDQNNNGADASGAAYVFVRNGASWAQQAYLKASNTDAHDNFGSLVRISGETVVVGASGEESSATGVNGDESDNSAGVSGAAYIFIRNGTTWSQQAYLKASNTGGYFGVSGAVSGNTIIIGARLESSNATGVNGDQMDNSAPYSGAAYVFERYGTTWIQQAYLKASNTDTGDRLCDTAISGNTIIIGAHGEDSSATGVNGNQADNSASSAGAAYVFTTDFSPGDYQATISACSPVAAGFVLEWIPVAGWDSVVKCSPDLVNVPFTNLSAALPYPVNSYTDSVSNGKCFYRVDLQP